MNRRRAFWFLVFTVLALSLVWHSWNSAYDHDEVEHLHAAWLISQGELPFRDFLEQHHPTLWYALAPLTAALNSPHMIVFAARILDLANLAAFLLLFVALVRLVYPSISARWPMLLLVASFTFTRNMVEVRPDPVMNTFTFAGLALWLGFLKDGRWWRAALAGLCFGMAMVILQKAMVVFGLIVVASILSSLPFVRGGIGWGRSLFAFPLLLLLAVVPLCALFFIISRAGIFDEFYFWNYTFNKFFYLNADISERFSILKTVWNGIVRNPVLWLSGVAGAGIVMKGIFTGRKTDGNWQEKFIVAVAAIGYFMLLATSKMPFDQYLIVFLPFMALASIEVFELLRARRLGVVYKVATVLMAAELVVILLAYPSNSLQREMQDYVIEHTSPNDTVAISPPNHPIIRRDGTYFWYNGAMIGRAYAELRASGVCDGRAIERDRAMWKENAPVFVYLDPDFKKLWPYHWKEYEEQYEATKLKNLMVIVSKRGL